MLRNSGRGEEGGRGYAGAGATPSGRASEAPPLYAWEQEQRRENYAQMDVSLSSFACKEGAARRGGERISNLGMTSLSQASRGCLPPAIAFCNRFPASKLSVQSQTAAIPWNENTMRRQEILSLPPLCQGWGWLFALVSHLLESSQTQFNGFLFEAFPMW